MKQKSYLLSKIRLFKTYPTPIGIRIFTFGSIAAYPTPDSLLKQLRPRSLYQNPLDGKYFSALYISVFIRSEACVAFYLNENASTMLPLSTSFTPFYLAVKRGFLNIVKLFLAKGADINEIHKTKTPLIVAAKRSHLPILLTMFDYKNNRTLKNLVTALLYLKKSLREDFLNLLDEGKLHNMLKNLELEVPNKKNRKVYELLQTKNHPLGLFAKTRSFYDKKALFTSEYEQRRISL